jgi:hypothetical protein
MIFYFFTTKRVLHVGQYDGIDDFVAFDLSSEKCPLVQFLIGEFYSSMICKRFDPLVAHSAPRSDDSVEDNTLGVIKFFLVHAPFICLERWCA